jgi:hypothetical protein
MIYLNLFEISYWCEGKKTALLQAEAGIFVLGLANVLFFVRGLLFSPMRPSGAKCVGGELKPLALMLALVVFIFVILFCHCQG